MTVMTGPIAIVGVPTALGGHLPGMELAPVGLRDAGLLDALAARPGLATSEWVDHGNLTITPGFVVDPDRRAKNRDRIIEFLPREAAMVADALAPDVATRLLVLGGDCLAHAGATAGLRRARPAARYAIAWFDAHGDFNTPDTTPSGNVFGMPFAMLCGIGDTDLVVAAAGPSVRLEDAALLGGQVLDEQESRVLAASPVAVFGAGMLGGAAGLAALDGWARSVAARVDGIYIAIDLDVLDASDGWAVTFPEPDGLPLSTAVAAVAILAAAMPVVGFGATGITLANGDVPATVAAVATLAEAALGPGA